MQREAAHIPAFECVGGANHQLRFPFFPFGAVGAIDTQSEVNTSCVESLPGYFVGRDPFPSLPLSLYPFYKGQATERVIFKSKVQSLFLYSFEMKSLAKGKNSFTKSNR